MAAVGQGTAAALQEAGIQDVIYPPTDWTSEGLLDLPYFQTVAQQKILLVRGEGGRELLADTLTLRGAMVEHLPVYQRILPTNSNLDLTLALLLQKKIDIIVCTSGESLDNLMRIIGMAHQSLLLDLALIVVSQRLVELAKEYHFQRIFLSENASHEAIIETLSLIRGKAYVRK